MALIRCHSNFRVNANDLNEEEFASMWGDLEYYLEVVSQVKYE